MAEQMTSLTSAFSMERFLSMEQWERSSSRHGPLMLVMLRSRYCSLEIINCYNPASCDQEGLTWRTPTVRTGGRWAAPTPRT